MNDAVPLELAYNLKILQSCCCSLFPGFFMKTDNTGRVLPRHPKFQTQNWQHIDVRCLWVYPTKPKCFFWQFASILRYDLRKLLANTLFLTSSPTVLHTLCVFPRIQSLQAFSIGVLTFTFYTVLMFFCFKMLGHLTRLIGIYIIILSVRFKVQLGTSSPFFSHWLSCSSSFMFGWMVNRPTLKWRGKYFKRDVVTFILNCCQLLLLCCLHFCLFLVRCFDRLRFIWLCMSNVNASIC